MAHERISDEIREQAALYALDLLEPHEARDFELHLSAGCPVCASELRTFRQTTALLPLGLPLSKPPSRVREKLLARVQGTPESEARRSAEIVAAVGLHIVRSGQGSWEPTGVPGVSFKPLYIEPSQESVTMLVRMEPGSTYPRHRHAAIEHCFVLEGDLRIGELVFRAGDYQCNASETIHEVSSTEQGNLLLIVASPHNELLA